jgi:hypothetical protein
MAVDLLGPILDQYLACGVAHLTTPVGRSFVQVGANVAHDDCCGGQLWVRVISIAPVYAGNTPANCGPIYYNAQLAMGTIRCAATVDDNGRAPEASTITAEAHDMTQDMHDTMQAIQCCERKPMPVIGSWTPTGPLGGCAGGEWTFTIKLDNCGCEVAP